MGEHLNLRVWLYALRWERSAIHDHDLELVYRPTVLNVREK